MVSESPTSEFIMVLRGIAKGLCQAVQHILPSQRTCMSIANVGGTLYFWAISVINIVVLFTVVLPGFHDDRFMTNLALGLAIYITPELYLNYLLCLYNSSYYRAVEGETQTVELLPPVNGASRVGRNWEYCVPCQHYHPPRAHHCPVCGRCILRRDSHCFVIGVCLGHRNLRFFLVFTFYCSIGLFCAVLFMFIHLSEHHAPVASWEGLSYLYPVTVFRWLTGSLESSVFSLVTLIYVNMMLCVGAASQFAWHFILVLRGQTAHESDSDVDIYDRGVFQNLSDTFGRLWMLPFFVPLPLHLPSDGIHFKKITKGF